VYCILVFLSYKRILQGPGEVVLAPEIWGDIVPISVRITCQCHSSKLTSTVILPSQVQPNVVWSVGKDAYLASTTNVTRSTKSQGFMKGLSKVFSLTPCPHLIPPQCLERGSLWRRCRAKEVSNQSIGPLGVSACSSSFRAVSRCNH
jgi:hypothetical protein